MRLTKHEKKQLGRAVRFVSDSQAAIRIWRWLSAAVPYVPRSEGELYVTALRKLRQEIQHTLEAAGGSGSAASWLMWELLQEPEACDESCLIRRMEMEVGLDVTRASNCLRDIQAALSHTPCLEEPIRTVLGYYCAAEDFLESLAACNASGRIPEALLEPMPAPVLAATSRIVYRQISVANDAGYVVALIRQLLGQRYSLHRDLERYTSRGGTGNVFWNMAAFFSDFIHETDVLEMLRYTELIDLVKAFAIVEYQVEQADKKADAGHTNALCALILIMVGEAALRPAQKVEIHISDMNLCGIETTDLDQRPDYIQALFWVGLERALPDVLWKKNALRAYRSKLAFPSLILSRTDWIVLMVLGCVMIYSVIAIPAVRLPALLLLGLLATGYLVFRGGLDLLMETAHRIVNLVWERCPLIMVLLVLVLLYFYFRYELPQVFEYFR